MGGSSGDEGGQSSGRLAGSSHHQWIWCSAACASTFVRQSLIHMLANVRTDVHTRTRIRHQTAHEIIILYAHASRKLENKNRP